MDQSIGVLDPIYKIVSTELALVGLFPGDRVKASPLPDYFPGDLVMGLVNGFEVIGRLQPDEPGRVRIVVPLPTEPGHEPRTRTAIMDRHEILGLVQKVGTIQPDQ